MKTELPEDRIQVPAASLFSHLETSVSPEAGTHPLTIYVLPWGKIICQ